MNKEEAISYLQQLYPYGGHCWIDEQRIEAIDMAIKSLQEKPVSEQKLSNVERIGKNWKEEQFEKNRLKHCNSITNEQAEFFKSNPFKIKNYE